MIGAMGNDGLGWIIGAGAAIAGLDSADKAKKALAAERQLREQVQRDGRALIQFAGQETKRADSAEAALRTANNDNFNLTQTNNALVKEKKALESANANLQATHVDDRAEIQTAHRTTDAANARADRECDRADRAEARERDKDVRIRELEAQLAARPASPTPQ